MSLYPTFDVPDIDLETVEEENYPGSWKFDFEIGEFVTDGGGKVQKSDPYVAWAHWCIKTAQTERFACLAYTSDIGIEKDEVRIQDTRKGSESVFEKTITEALKVHPFTDSVQNFEFNWTNGNLNATFIIYPVDGMPVEVNSTIIF